MIVKVISIYLFAGVMLLSFLFANSFNRSKSSYAKALAVLSITLQIYLLGYLLEINSTTLKEMYFWNGVQYFGIPFFPGLWLVISMLYTGRGKYLKGFRSLVVFAVPIMTLLFRLTNNWHHLFYIKVELVQKNGLNIMMLTKGPWYMIHVCYILVTLILCSWFYFQRYRKSIGDEKIQFRLLLLLSTLPYITLVLVTLNIGGTGIDYTAFILPPCILLLEIALTRYNFLEIKILARDKVFEDSTAGKVLLNRLYRIVDYNSACIGFFQLFHAQLKEDQIELILKDSPDLLEGIKNFEQKILCITVDDGEQYIRINTKEVQNKGEVVGFLVTFDDVTERELLKKRLIELADTDELTGLYNRRKFNECAKEAFQRAGRYQERLSTLMMDLDFFKVINDTFGHQTGDEVLRVFSALLAETFRETDIIGRMGGEEFSVVMLNTDAEKAFRKAEEFRKAVEAKDIYIGQHRIKLTVSIGVAELGENVQDFDLLLNHADQALYEAKHKGRNCTVIEEHL